MKKTQLIVNVILFVAIAALYAIHFISKNPTDGISNNQDSDNTLPASLNSSAIAYINIDSLLTNYDLYYDMRKKLETQYKTSQNELDVKAKNYEKEIKDYQYKLQRGLITRSTAQQMEQELIMKEQTILKLKEDLSIQLAEEEQVMNRQLIHGIVEYLKEYNKNGKYQFVLSTSFGDNILYANDSLNITQNVLKGLNNQYKNSLEKK